MSGRLLSRALLSALAAAGALALGACETRVETPTYADITFTHQEPIALDVAEIRVVRVYEPTSQPPNVETEFPVSPLETAARWAEDRLKAVGDSGVATYRILDASVVEKPLDKKSGVTGLFTTDQSEKYDARYLIELVAEDDDGGRRAEARTEVTRTQTVLEDLTYNQRARVWYQMTEKMAADLDRRMSETVRQHMRPFLTR